jgi:hypothetical protein
MGGARDLINRCGVECGEDQRWVGTENAELIVGNTQALPIFRIERAM